MDLKKRAPYIANFLSSIAALNLGFVLGAGAIIHSPPTQNTALVPRGEALYVVGQNRFGLTRILSFSDVKSAEQYLTKLNMQVPTLNPAHLREKHHTASSLSSHNLTWSHPDYVTGKPTPIIETNSQETAEIVKNWINKGHLKASRYGFSIPLEAKP